MKLKQILLMFFGIKGFLVLLCFSLLCVQYAMVRSVPRWFGEAVREQDIKKELESEKNVDMVNDEGFTGLMIAVARMNIDVVRAFLSAGADVNMHGQNDAGDTPLHTACYNGNFAGAFDMIMLLIDAGADVRAKNNRGETPLHFALGQISMLNLDLRRKVLSHLIKYGANINAKTNRGETPLHVVASKNELGGTRMLLDDFGTLIDLGAKNNDGQTAQQLSFDMGFRDVADTISKGAIVIDDATSRDRFGLNGLMLWVIRGDTQMVNKLFGIGAEIDAKADDKIGFGVLHFALLHQNVDMFDLLVKKNARVDIPSKSGNLPIHLVPRVKNVVDRIRALNILIEKDRGILNAKNSDGNTLLHLVAKKNDRELLMELLNSFWPFVDTTIHNNDNKRAIDLARDLKYDDLVPLLESVTTALR